MRNTARRTLIITGAVAALATAGTGLAYASTGHHHSTDHSKARTQSSTGYPAGGGSGLSGGPTDAQVLQGAPPVPLSDPTLGEGAVLPPAYNGLGG
jgi:hypothetical protein